MENNDKIMNNNVSCASRYNCSINDDANSKTWHWTVSSIHSAHLDPNVQYITSVWKSFVQKTSASVFTCHVSLYCIPRVSSKKSLYQMHQKCP